MYKKAGRHTVVLLGVGHTNAHVLRMCKMYPQRDAQLVCISNFPVATYSGMVPGVLAGQYPVADMEIDLVRLCNSAGARLILGDVESLDTAERKIHFHDRPPLAYDALSIGVGSRPSFDGVEVHDGNNLLAVKPMQTFLERLKTRMTAIENGTSPARILVVGGGIGSIEIAFCLNHRLKTDPAWTATGDSKCELTLVTGGDRVGSGLLARTQDKIAQQFESRGIKTKTGGRVVAVDQRGLEFKDGSVLEGDIIIWATTARPPEILNRFEVEKDEVGFLAVRPTLQSVSDDRVFAVGDTGTVIESPTAKAGVFAVRQGPVLWDNIQRVLEGKPLRKFVPQKGFLKLVNTGDGKTIAEYLGRSFYGKWCWKLKDRIDVKFMRMYQDYSLMEMPPPSAADQETAMRCLGCGGKVGSAILSSVISELDVRQNDDVIIGLDAPDDAAIVRAYDNQVTVTTDFFAAPFEDPYLVGRIATLNSASDCFVMGARPTSALAIVQLPLGHPRGQMQVMRELMAGSVEELNRMGAAIVGGHSIEGPRTMIGYTILGRQVCDPKTKSGLRAGDRLVLTKPLGTGIMLAALMQSQLPGIYYPDLLDSMLLSNEIALELIERFPVHGLTDVTGFGLAGHLAEMMRASSVDAAIEMSRIALLDGCDAMMDLGIESTLADDNRAVSASVDLVGAGTGDRKVTSLFDPQTGGGLLMGVAEADCAGLLDFLRESGFEHSAVIGEVIGPAAGDKPQLRIG